MNGRTIYHPRGKMLGGCSGQNAMIYIRGNRSDYDSWAKNGAVGWSYEEVLPLFKRSEHNSRGASDYHGASGPMFVEDPRSPNELSQRIIEAMVASGISRSDDFNGPEQLGAGLYQVTQKRGQRWTTSDGYVRPARSRASARITDASVAISSALVASSRISIGASLRIARAIVNRCRSPPDRLAPRSATTAA